jgi:uncharacterized protein
VKKKNLFTRRLIWISSFCFIAVCAVVMGISYYALSNLTFAGDRALYGKKFSDLAQEIRTELLKRSDLTQISFKSPDGLTLSGFIIKRPNPKANLVLCHGYKVSKELMYGYIDLFPEWNILMFDFRAHGQSEGSITSIGYHEAKDATAAIKYLRDYTQQTTNKKLPLIAIGISMGGAALLKAAESESGFADALIIDSSYAQLDATVRKAFSVNSSLPRYPFFFVIKNLFHYFANCDIHSMNPVEFVKNIDTPIFFIHSCDDGYISPKNSLKLYASAQNKSSKLWIGPHCRHAWLHSYHSDLYKRKVAKFLRQTIPALVI